MWESGWLETNFDLKYPGPPPTEHRHSRHLVMFDAFPAIVERSRRVTKSIPVPPHHHSQSEGGRHL